MTLTNPKIYFNLCVEVVNRMAKDLFRREIWSDVVF